MFPSSKFAFRCVPPSLTPNPVCIHTYFYLLVCASLRLNVSACILSYSIFSIISRIPQLPEEVHNQLESLPEQWNNTKKIAIQVRSFFFFLVA